MVNRKRKAKNGHLKAKRFDGVVGSQCSTQCRAHLCVEFVLFLSAPYYPAQVELLESLIFAQIGYGSPIHEFFVECSPLLSCECANTIKWKNSELTARLRSVMEWLLPNILKIMPTALSSMWLS